MIVIVMIMMMMMIELIMIVVMMMMMMVMMRLIMGLQLPIIIYINHASTTIRKKNFHLVRLLEPIIIIGR